MKCNRCEYRCKKDVKLRKHINTNHDNNTCTKCHLRFDNISELQKHNSEDHCIAVKDKVETKTDKRDEQDKDESIKKYDDRCNKCGYILFTEDTYEKNGKQQLVCQLCPILDQRQQT